MKNRILALAAALALLLLTAAAGAAAGETAEKNGDIVILFTSDVHCGIDQNFGFAGLQRVREYLESEGNSVILVDNGDQIQGEPIGTYTKGEAIIDLMNAVGYNIAIPGNHEFDYGMDCFLNLVKRSKHQYISCNLTYKDELMFEPYTVRELTGKKVAFIGVTTPTTFSASNPTTFQDENGETVYGFLADETGEKVYSAVQSAADAARAEGAEIVVILGHMGNEAACRPWTYADVISHTSGIDVFLDGHSHDTDQVVMKNAGGKDVLRAACGTKLQHIGWCRIAADGKITAGLYTWSIEIPAPKLFGIENEAARMVDAAMEKMTALMSEVVCGTAVDLMSDDPLETDFNGQAVRMIRVTETNMGDLAADAFRIQGGADIALINSGGVRKNIEAGDITYGALLKTWPYNSYLCVLEVTGGQILDALELGAALAPIENGNFLQVSGLTYEIHTYIPSGVVTDEEGMFVRVEGERRVKNVRVNGEPIDPEKAYILAGRDFMLTQYGGGFTMFKSAKVLQDAVKVDTQVMSDYINESLGGTVGAEYEDPYGQGRITIIEKPE